MVAPLVPMVAPLVPMVAPLVPCRAISLTHTSLGSGRGIFEREAREETGCAAWLGTAAFEQVVPYTGVLCGSQAGF
jgi:hypothetical protein